MGRVLAIDTWQGETTRIYVAYPDRAAAERWERDPDLQTQLTALRGPDGVHHLGVGWGYPNSGTNDYVITIARIG